MFHHVPASLDRTTAVCELVGGVTMKIYIKNVKTLGCTTSDLQSTEEGI